MVAVNVVGALVLGETREDRPTQGPTAGPSVRLRCR